MPLPAATADYNAVVAAGSAIAAEIQKISGMIGPTYTAANGLVVNKIDYLVELQKQLQANYELQSQLMPFELRSEVL